MRAVLQQIDMRLAEWATPTQLKYLEAVAEHGSGGKAAKALGVTKNAVNGALQTLAKAAAVKGYSPPHDWRHPVPDGFKAGRISTSYKADGTQGTQWVIATPDQNRLEELLHIAAKVMAQEVKGNGKVTKPPAKVSQDLMCVVPMGDPHFGLYAWWQDAGDDFDLSIAERLTCGAVDRLLATSPDAAVGMLLNLGDMYHADNQNNLTQSGHQLDVDGRWAKVQQVGLKAMLYCLKQMLGKYERVVFRINRGNHDGHSAYALALMISCYFHDEPRIEVDLSPAVCWYYQFGKVLIGSTHGDTIKGPGMPGLMATDKPAEWGTSAHRYWYVGHVHHQDTKEYPGAVVEYFRTLAARDAWHAGQGYRAGRDMRLIVLHKEHGEVERHRCDVGMLA